MFDGCSWAGFLPLLHSKQSLTEQDEETRSKLRTIASYNTAWLDFVKLVLILETPQVNNVCAGNLQIQHYCQLTGNEQLSWSGSCYNGVHAFRAQIILRVQCKFGMLRLLCRYPCTGFLLPKAPFCNILHRVPESETFTCIRSWWKLCIYQNTSLPINHRAPLCSETLLLPVSLDKCFRPCVSKYLIGVLSVTSKWTYLFFHRFFHWASS